MMTLKELVKPLRVFRGDLTSNPIIEQLEMDSRQVKPGALFFCIKGYTDDGHDFAAQAVEKGAVALVAERELEVGIPVIVVPDSRRAMAKLANYFYQDPTSKLQLIGVTGTNGKTSITHILEQILLNDKKKNWINRDDVYENRR